METPFDSWYNGVVGFHINSERILDDIYNSHYERVEPEKLRQWMVVCWNNAIDAAENKLVEGYDYDDNRLLLTFLKEKP